MATSKVKRNPHRDITLKVLEQMREYGTGWSKPWKGSAVNGLHYNPATGTVYAGGNQILLWVAAANLDSSDSRWSTYKGWQKLGHPVPKGEKAGAYIVAPTPFEVKDSKGKPVLDSKGKPKTGMGFRAEALWNAQQVGAEPLVAEVRDPVAVLQNVEDFIANYISATGVKLVIQPGSERAYYSPIKDKIVIPSIEDFYGDTPAEKQQAYYGTELHEVGHSTGEKSRLNRVEIYERNEENYAKEELCAEMFAVLACAALGIEHTPSPDHAQYLASWMKALENDERLFFRAANKAQKALEYVQSKQPNTNDAAEQAA